MHLPLSLTLALLQEASAPLAPAPTSSTFGADLVIVADAQQFAREWELPGPHAAVHVVQQIKVGQPATAFIVFRGCRSAPDGACHVKAALQVVGPDGKPTPLSGTFTVWSKAAPPSGMLYRSEQALTIQMDQGALLGRYTVRAMVTDEAGGSSPTTLAKVKVLTLVSP